MKVVISGGGTGGHIFPAIAIADELKYRIPDVQISFVGAIGRMEMEKIPKAGYPIEGLWISGLQRKLTTKNLLFPIKLLSSLWNARKIIKRCNPDVVIGVGGYASGPTLFMANVMGIPTLIQEQNSYPGITNKLLANRADRICVAYKDMNRFFDSSKLVLTGNPIRKSLIENNDCSTQSSLYFGLNQNKKTLLIFGGSLGARSLNEAIRDSFELIAQHSDVNIIWQVGTLYYEEFKTTNTALLNHVKVLPFIDRMDLAYRAADLAVCRAGALTISELCLVGQAAILVPSPNVSEDHQTKNAQALVNHDAAIMIADKDAKSTLAIEMMKTIYDDHKLSQLSNAALHLAMPRATEDIVDEIMNIAQPA
jgi:UDP-N-acetylglucosamine--N-acetylmuramyl-(pentapeptide) pyrophosphoryl-undecaprenol N-acetylglucosamine transferase